MGSRAHSPADSTRLLQRLQAVRQHSERLIDGLEPEDLCLQGMADASPAKWHLGHTTWFFETFLLEPHLPGHATPDRRWGHLFNSYYEAVGSRHPPPAGPAHPPGHRRGARLAPARRRRPGDAAAGAGSPAR